MHVVLLVMGGVLIVAVGTSIGNLLTFKGIPMLMNSQWMKQLKDRLRIR
jgi:hypothetical protein